MATSSTLRVYLRTSFDGNLLAELLDHGFSARFEGPISEVDPQPQDVFVPPVEGEPRDRRGVEDVDDIAREADDVLGTQGLRDEDVGVQVVEEVEVPIDRSPIILLLSRQPLQRTKDVLEEALILPGDRSVHEFLSPAEARFLLEFPEQIHHELRLLPGKLLLALPDVPAGADDEPDTAQERRDELGEAQLIVRQSNVVEANGQGDRDTCDRDPGSDPRAECCPCVWPLPESPGRLRHVDRIVNAGYDK